MMSSSLHSSRSSIATMSSKRHQERVRLTGASHGESNITVCPISAMASANVDAHHSCAEVYGAPVPSRREGALRATAAQMAYAGSLRNPALDALVLHLCIGDTWNCITNVERRLGVSAIGCFAVWGSVFRAVKAFGASAAPKAAYVLAPSLAWISVACVLTASIWNLNNRPPIYPAEGDGDSADLRLKYLLQMEATSIRGGK